MAIGRLHFVIDPERVNAFVTKGQADAYCDDCIAEGLDLPSSQQVALVTSTLVTTDRFNRSIGECAICGMVKPTTARSC